MGIFFNILSYIQDNPLPVLFIIIALCIFLLAAFLLLANKCKLNTIFFNFFDIASKIAQITALIIGISYGYSAINTYDVKKMEKEKEKLQGDIHVMQALITINSEVLENKNNEINELSRKMNNLNFIIGERENELRRINKERYLLKYEINSQEAELDNQYKILFKRLFILESYNTMLNMWIRHTNGFHTVQSIEKKINQYMPSPYTIITESLSTIKTYGIPSQKVNELKMLIYKEIENDISLRQQKFTYKEYQDSMNNGLLYGFRYIKINNDGSFYMNAPENILKSNDVYEFIQVPYLLLDTISNCVDRAFKL